MSKDRAHHTVWIIFITGINRIEIAMQKIFLVVFKKAFQKILFL
jgi:hypothetical protein